MTRDEFLSAYAEAHRIRREQGEIARPLLVGEDNPYSARPSDALLPYPDRSAGARLCRDILGLSVVDYLAKFDRVNLCGQKWNDDEARRVVGAICANGHGRVLVLLGAKVLRAFLLPQQPPPEFFTRGEFATCGNGAVKYVALPHPSGRSREWNQPGAVERARAAMREAGAL